ncbi:MAG TPA: Gmad2 immunoglobulin-like domain-containing protein [Candidatus Paceibacterota bacterium]|nr:Gmad2 immunoglobulin-like domain-containing protein [Candidatus Paceibacterota bacterium]
MTKTRLVIIIVIILAIVYAIFAFDVPYRKVSDNLPSVEQATSTAATDKVILESPQAGSAISSPVALSGVATSSWYFEAVFPVEVVAEDGVTVLGRGQARSLTDWMAYGFAPFTASISFNAGTSTKGFIRLMKDNASGDPRHDEHVDVPVIINSK